MKKTLLSAFALCALVLGANAQSFTNGATGYLVDYYGNSATPNCLHGTNGNGGYAAAGASLNNTNVGTKTTNGKTVLEFNSNGKTIDPYGGVAFYDLYYTIGSGASATCNPLSGNDNVGSPMGVDMSSHYTVNIVAKASVDGAKLDVFVASADATFYPGSSTYNTGAASNNSITKTITLSTSWATYLIDFSAVPADKAIFDAWTGGATSNAMVNQVGFRAQTTNTVYDIAEIALGSAAVTPLAVNNAVLPSNVTYYPNPSNSNITVSNMDVTSLKLMNLSGSVVRETSNSSVSVEGLNPGMYFLQINGFKPVKVTVE